MKTRMLLCILGLLAISLVSTSAFAQSTLSVGSVPRTTATSTGHTEIAGDIQVNASAIGAQGAGSATLTVDYGAPITVPAAGFIIVCGQGTLAGPTVTASCPTGAYAANGSGTSGTFQIGGSNQNQLLIVLPGYGAANAATGSLTINGVKVSLNGFTGTKLTASLGVSASAIFGAYSIGSGQNSTDVISSIAPAFTTATASSAAALGTLPAGLGRSTILTTTTITDRTFNIDIPENYVDAFRTTLGQSGFLNDPSLTLTFSNIPTGLFLNLAGGVTGGASNTACSGATADTGLFYTQTSGVNTAIPVGNLTNSVISSSTNSTVLSFTGLGFNATQLETIRLRGCIYTSGATAPLAVGTVAAAITLSPNGVGLSSGTQIAPVAGNFPRFQASTVSVNVVDIIAAKTDLLMSFAAKNPSGFDTGIAIANTTTDNLGTAGASSITGNEGTLQLWFYPQGSGSSFSYTTAAGSPGQGLSANGVLATGKTWSVGLSELLGAISGAPTSFAGYIIVRANFTNAHGAAYITDYKGFTSNTPFLVMTGRTTTDENFNH